MSSIDRAERRAEAVERLRRPVERRSLFRRPLPLDPWDERPAPASTDATGASPVDADLSPGEVRRRSSMPFDKVVRTRQPAHSPWSLPRIGVPVLIGALVVAVAVGWLLLRRPAPVDDALPLATAAARSGVDGVGTDAATTTASPVGSSDATTAGPDDSAGGGTSGVAGSAPSVTVHVVGAVASPGVVSLPDGSRVVDAVSAAGGLRPDADPDRVNLAAQLSDGARIVIPVTGQPPPVEVTPTGGGTDPSTGGTTGSPVVDVNQATAEQLDALPGVGPATAKAIIDHRDKNGRFGSVDDLLEVRGIGDAKLESLRDLVTVGP